MNKRQLLLFTILLVIIASLCRYFDDGLGGVYEGPNSSMYAWAISPIFMTLVFRLYNKDWKGLDIKPNFIKNWKWYVLGILGIPLIYFIEIFIYQITDNVEITENFSISLILNSVVAGFGLVFLKNISEEFTWRGYLTYSLNERGMSRLQNHLIVGAIWLLWHVPFLGRGITFETGNNFWISLCLWIIAVLFISIIYGEIRLRSKTVWTLVLLHTFDNLLIGPLLNYEMLILPKNSYFVGLLHGNILPIILFGVIGWLLYKQKFKNERSVA